MEKTVASNQSYDNFVEYSSNNEEKSTQSEDEGSSWDIPIRSRQRFPRDQLKTLENLYASNKRPDYEDKEELATRFGTTVKRIQIWFQNRRAKDKKEPKKQTSGGGDKSSSVSIPSSPEGNNSVASTSATMVSTPQEPPTVNPSHISSRSPEKRPRFPRAPISRRYPPQERHPMHYPSGTPMHNAAPPPPTFFYHHPYYHSDLWHPKFRVSAPQIVNQSRNTPVEHSQQRTSKRVTRSQSKKR
jgi:hypothetical protein